MLSVANLPLQIPDVRGLPTDLSDVTGRVRHLAEKAPFVPQKKRSRLSLAWPILFVLAGIGLYMAVRSRRTSTADVGESRPSGAYARN